MLAAVKQRLVTMSWVVLQSAVCVRSAGVGAASILCQLGLPALQQVLSEGCRSALLNSVGLLVLNHGRAPCL